MTASTVTNPTIPLQRLTLTTAEAADLLGICERSVRTLIKAGAFGPPASCKIGSRVCIPRQRVERFAAGERGGDSQ